MEPEITFLDVDAPVMAVVTRPDFGEPIRRWWEAFAPDVDPRRIDPNEIPSIVQAISQVSMVSLAHLMREMMNGDLSVPGRQLKMRIALAMAPKIVQEFKGKIPLGGGHAGADHQGGDPSGGTGGLLAELYGTKTVRVGLGG